MWDGTDLSAAILAADPADKEGERRAVAGALGLHQSRSKDAPPVGSVMRVGVGLEHGSVVAMVDDEQRIRQGGWVKLRGVVRARGEWWKAGGAGGGQGQEVVVVVEGFETEGDGGMPRSRGSGGG